MAPLDSWRVLDLTDLRGAMCARILADFGADVVRFEPAAAGRREAVQGSADAYRNANKRIAAMPTPDELPGWLDQADIVVENLSPDRRVELGLDPATVAARHPGVVHVAIADFGLSGPRSHWRLEPLTAQAAGGTLFASGFPDRAPCWFPGFLGHDCASVYGAVGAVAAVMDRRRHGRGQTIEISVQEATLSGTNPWSVAVNDYLKINPFLPAEGKRNADGFYQVLPASDGWVRFVIGNEKQWRGTLRLAREPEVLTSPEWLDPFYRRMNADVARLVLAELLQDRTRTELFEEARQTGATLGVIHMPREYAAHPQTVARDVFQESRLAGSEGAPVVRPPLRFSATPARRSVEPAQPAPDRPWSGGSGVSGGSGRSGASGGGGGSGGAGTLLDGVRVVEFGMAAVGPEVSLVLSELGADVIKIESTTHLDVLRQSGFDRINCGFAFNTECRGRRSVALSLGTDEGRALAFGLCAAADVIVENFRGGVLEGLGLGYEAVKGSNPDVIYASSQGYGRTGPLAGMPAYGPLNLGFVGLHHLWNHRDAPYPCGTSLNHPDHIAGKFLAAGVLAALDHRSETGEGQHLDLAQTELAAYLRGEVYIDAWCAGADPVAEGNDSPSACPHGVFPAAGDDRWLAIVVSDDDEWVALCKLAGWAADPELEDLDGRLARRDEIAARLGDWTMSMDAVELSELLQAHGISACPVMGPLEHLADEHLASRGYIVELQHPEVGPERHENNPIRMSVTPQRLAAAAPCLGAHTVEVLGEVLGVTPEEVDRLVAAGVCV